MAVFVFIGTTKVKNLDANIGSLTVKLTTKDLKEISDAIPTDQVGGQREVQVFVPFSYRSANTPPKA